MLTATATDSAGGTGTATRSVTVSNTTSSPDPTTNAPFSATISSPVSGATVKGSRSIAVSTTASSTQNKQMTVRVDGTTLASNSLLGTAMWVSWDTRKFSDGPHTITLTVTQNGSTATATRSVTVANNGGTSTPPAPSGLAVDFVNLASGSTMSGTTTLGYRASGGSGTGYGYVLAVDGAMVAASTGTSAPWDTTRFANGSHTLSVTVTDSAGSKAIATRTITVANTTTSAPQPQPASFTASFSYPAEGAIVNGGHTVGMATTATWGQPKTFTLLVDNTVILSQSFTGTTLWITWDTTPISNGAHTLTLKVTDGTGATATATRAVTVAN